MKTAPAIFGALIAVGTFDSSALAVALVIIAWGLWITRREPPPVPGIILAGAIALSAPGGAVPGQTLFLAVFILCLVTVSRQIRLDRADLSALTVPGSLPPKGGEPGTVLKNLASPGGRTALAGRADDAEYPLNSVINSFFVGLLAGIGLQLYSLAIHAGDFRPGGLSLNASQVAQVGLMFWLILPAVSGRLQLAGFGAAALQLGIAVSRGPLAAALAFLLMKPSRVRALMFSGIIISFLFFGTLQGNLHRVLPESVAQAAGVRADLMNGGELTWTGYGLGGYIEATGQDRPHNIPVLLAYELGILAVVPAGLFAWAVWTRRIPVDAAITLLLLWQLVEEPAGRIEGILVTCGVLVALWKRQEVMQLKRKPPARSPGAVV